MRALVTGGGGFLGSAIARMLVERGDEVTVLGRNRYPELEALGCSGIVADLSEGPPDLPDDLDVIFHVAALAGMWGPYERYFAVNVQGTRHMLEASRSAGAQRFVYTSSPSVTFRGKDEENVTEAECDYPESFPFHYPATKAQAEQEVLEANDPEFATTSLRPHLIYGPGDPHLLPRLIARQRAGRLRIIGEGANKVAVTYVDNAAVAHLQAADALHPGSVNSGKAYFITDGEPVRCWDWLERTFVELGLGPIRGRISRSTAFRVAACLEWVWRSLDLSGEPPITKFTVEQVSSSHWYDLTAAREDFAYQPVVSGDEGFRRMVAALRG